MFLSSLLYNDDGPLVSCWNSQTGVYRGAILDVSLLPPVMMRGRYPAGSVHSQTGV